MICRFPPATSLFQIQAESVRVPESLHLPLVRPPSVSLCLYLSPSLSAALSHSPLHILLQLLAQRLRLRKSGRGGCGSAREPVARHAGLAQRSCVQTGERKTRCKGTGRAREGTEGAGQGDDWGRDREGRAKNGTRGSPALHALLARGGRPPHLVLQAPCVLLPDLRAGRADGVCVCVCVLSE